ncbi:hypothetical protein F8M41_007744 [Gigaspora margarita]|uniref:Uncharacterized protein n=1 Tax=Gigaspora margarita TaxID=4874 RepID=A0A8H3X5X5_GIGMA|nr:hypothetical protein F8M41_007744 [Gigaspora margarita]
MKSLLTAATQNFNLNLNASSSNVTSSHITRAIIIYQIDKRSGEYQIQEFFYKNDSVIYYDSPITSVILHSKYLPYNCWKSFKASKKVLNHQQAKEHSFYLVSQVEGNTGFGLKFFQGKNMFATMSNKSYNRETRDVVVQDGTPFPSLIPTLYAIYYDY